MKKKNTNSLLNDKRKDTIAEILEDLRIRSGLSRKELAALFNVSYETISHYERALTIPPPDVLLKYADFSNVTTDYILNRTSCQIDYSAIMDKKIGKDMTISDAVEIIDGLTKEEKEHLSYIIKLFIK